MATKSVDYIFDNYIYQKIDGVAMGSTLGPLVANSFVCFHERQLIDKVPKPCCYFGYVDDTLTSFSSDNETGFYNI